MSNKAARPESQSCAVMCFDTPSVLIESGSIGRPETDARCRDGPGVHGKATSRDEADLLLPPPETKRWSSRRKAAILVAVRAGVITREEACQGISSPRRNSPVGRWRSTGQVFPACSRGNCTHTAVSLVTVTIRPREGIVNLVDPGVLAATDRGE